MTSPTALPARFPWFRRRAIAVSAVAAGLAIAGMGTMLQQASAEPVDSKIAATCAMGTGTIDVTVPLTVDDKVDPVDAGGSEVLVTKTGAPALPVDATINKLVVTTPVPAQINSIDDVTFSGGNMKSSYSVSGSNIIVTFTGPVDSKSIQVPTVTAKLTVRSDAAGTIDWKPFSEVDADTNFGLAKCKPNDPNQAVNTTTVTASSPSTTAGAPTPTAPEPTSTTTPAKSPTTTVPPKSKSPKSKGAGVSGSASAGASVKGSSGGASGSTTGQPPLPGVPDQPGTSGLPTPPVPALPNTPAPALPATPVPALPNTPVPALPNTPAPALPNTPAPTLPATPAPGSGAPAIPGPGISVGVSGSVRVTP